MSEKIAMTIVVQGKPVSIEAEPNAEVRSLIGRALAESGNVGQPPDSWELRDTAGTLIDLAKKISDYAFTSGVTLFLNLRAGVGGSA